MERDYEITFSGFSASLPQKVISIGYQRTRFVNLRLHPLAVLTIDYLVNLGK